MGSLSYDPQRGMYLDPTYAVTPEREPLGTTDIWMWSRERRDEIKAAQPQDKEESEAKEKESESKESMRWIKGYEGVAEMAAKLPETRLVYVADRESDIVALMVRAEELGTPADWLIRAKHNRNLPDGDKLWNCATEGKALGGISFMMPARHGKKAREVRQQLWSERVQITAGKGKTIEITCIIAREIDAPLGVKPVEWRLLSNRSAPTLSDVIELIDWYRARWEIEMFFNVLKNACEVEALQLSTIERVERALVLFMVVAWRISHLMHLGRICPDIDAELFSSR
jgi:IS4 transposase